MTERHITITLTEFEAQKVNKALGYMTLEEEIGEGEYPFSWLSISRRINKKLRNAGAKIEEAA